MPRSSQANHILIAMGLTNQYLLLYEFSIAAGYYSFGP